MKRQNFFLSILILVIALGGLACMKEVPPGYVGMRQEASGFDGTVLQPGKHNCWGRCKMNLIETREDSTRIPLNILCKDGLNMKFDLVVRTRLRAKDPKAIVELFNVQGSKMQYQDGFDGRVLAYSNLFGTYVQPLGDSIARGVVSKYETTGILENRETITGSIFEKLSAGMKGSPTELVTVTISNLDYPDVIENSLNKRRQREIEIEEERANQAKELLKVENRIILAQKEKEAKLAEAEADAVELKVVGKALTDKYLEFKRLQVQRTLYERVGEGDKMIFTDGGVVPQPLLNLGNK